ncbi:MAG: hypothetical protein HQM00_17360 [Magnetococcales bacterium]|nr:hypothetical protein [Magnetococcales bacterium]
MKTPHDIVLGFWDGHDSGAALMVEGRLLCAVNEERFTRRKQEIAFPRHAIAACLRHGKITPEQVQLLAGCTTDPAKTISRLWPAGKERYYRLRRRLADPSPLDPWSRRLKYHLTEWPGNGLTARLSTFALKRELQRLGLNAPLSLFDHHLCHAATAAYGLGLDESLVITLDGVGDGRSGSFHHFRQGELRHLSSLAARDSLGIFFEQITTLLHMRELEDEGKVMALADYAPAMAFRDNPLRELFAVEGLNLRARHHASGLYRHLERIFWRHAPEPFAAMAQQALEAWVIPLVTQAVASTGLRHLALAGGVFANVRLNGRIRQVPGVESCTIFPHMGDGGLAVGAACLGRRPQGPLMRDAQLGPEPDPQEVTRAVRSSGLPHRAVEDPASEAARLLTEGRIVGWFQGRMEYGPRALGGRSVLARPDLPEIRDILNLRLKRRAWYQPFCPSMLDSEAERLLSDYSGLPNRFMTALYRFRPEFRAALSGVSGRDGSCRPQMVADDAPGPYAALLRALRRSTGFGVVLNTSFNPHGAPIVNTPEEALNAFRAMGLDHLVIGGWVVDSSL